MKKSILLVFAAALVMFAACQKEESLKKSMELSASVEQQSDPSAAKSTLDGTTVKWVAGDKIKVYNANGSANTDLTANTGGTSTTFSGSDLSSGSPAVAIYPASIASGYDGTNISFTLPATQTYAENSFGQDANVAVGVVSGANISFKNVCGILKFQLKGTYTVSKIELSGNSDEKLNGEYSVNASSPSMTCTTTSTDTEKIITLDCGTTGVALSTTSFTTFYFVIPTGALANGFTAKVYEKDNSTAYAYTQLSTTSANTISRSFVKAMPGTIILPPAYQKVEYLESTGTQYIDTGFTYAGSDAATDEVEIQFSITEPVKSSAPDRSIFGSSYVGSKGNRCFELGIISYCIRENISGGWNNSPYSNDVIYTYKAGKDGFWNKRQSPGINTSRASLHTSLLFGRWFIHEEHSVDRADKLICAKMYYLIVKRNDAEILHYIPCYAKDGEEAGMYDVIADKFVGNSGTGDFIAGAIVNH